MTALSFSLAAGQNQEQITVGTLAPAVAGSIEIRIDTTAVIHDSSVASGVRPLNSGEIAALDDVLKAYIIAHRNLFPWN